LPRTVVDVDDATVALVHNKAQKYVTGVRHDALIQMEQKRGSGCACSPELDDERR